MFNGNETFSSGDFAVGPAPSTEPLHIRHIPIDATWPVAPQHGGTLGGETPGRANVADALHRKWRESRVRLQLAIDIVESPVLLLHSTGEVTAANRAWRMAAKAGDIRDAQSNIGSNYLNAFRADAAAGNRDAAISAEGIEGVLEGRSRSFYYKYRWNTANERRLYALFAWCVEEDGTQYIAVSHELLEAHSYC
jgi:hypothetical protein